MNRTILLSVSLVLSVSGCSFLSVGKGMNDTKVVSSPDNYDKLAAAGTTLGWKSQRGTGKRASLDDWDLQMFPKDGETIFFTRNNNTGNIAFTCKGGSIDGRDPCIAAANKVFEPAFQSAYTE